LVGLCAFICKPYRGLLREVTWLSYFQTVVRVKLLGEGKGDNFLGALTKLQKSTLSFMPIYTSTWNNSDPTWRIFMKLDV
jgi:hypothetical protein